MSAPQDPTHVGRPVTEHVTLVEGARGGRYPHGNALVVRGADTSVVIDPAVGFATLADDDLPRVDFVLNSHCHEDHVAGNHRFPDVPWHLHERDVVGLRSLGDMMAIYGFDEPEIDATFRTVLVDEFHWRARPDATSFRGGDVFDLGGGVRIHAIDAPGHTRGHSFFRIEPDDVVYLGDVDLSSFGPYYGDAWSDLADFERTLALARSVDARAWATFHHIGVIDDRAAYDERLDRYEAVIATRERRLVEFLAEPRTMDDVVRHRFVYRPQDEILFADPVERRSMGQHLERLLASGRVVEVEPGRYHATERPGVGRPT